tara:strand:+ start:9630 stop:9830 length:201 start_codon:yes stop_codon:yes gene_type:complete
MVINWTMPDKYNKNWKEDIDHCLVNVLDYIVESEMEGKVDEEDSYYPTFLAIHDLLEKVMDEKETS